MPIDPTRGTGYLSRPLLESDIRAAQAMTRSGGEAARYLKVNYDTYKRYAKMYGLFDSHKATSSKGFGKNKVRGQYGLKSILNNEHPNYDRRKLKMRLIKAGYLAEECGMCGFNGKRVIDGRCPLILHTLDGTDNLNLDNLQLRCYNCTYLTTGHVKLPTLMSPGVTDGDLEDRGLTQEDIDAIQSELMQDED